ncbi:MAG: GxxExxY protein [Phycisphaeraceae bacterium]|nr:GxxExxY protein [Phycisphaeraceae bacterium]
MSGDYSDSYGHSRGSGGGGGRGGRGRGRDGGGHHERRGIPLEILDKDTTDASRKVIGAAIEVHKTLGPGYTQQIYTAALKSELDALGVKHEAGRTFDVKYKDAVIGTVGAALLVDGRFLLEIVSRPGQVSTHERLSLRAQLKAADMELGLIINFAERRLKDGLVRVVNVDKITREKGVAFEEHDEEGPEIHDFEQH